MHKPVVGWFEVTGRTARPGTPEVLLGALRLGDQRCRLRLRPCRRRRQGHRRGIAASAGGGEGGVTFYVEIDDPAEYLKGQSLGGKTVVSPTEVPGIGLTFAFLADPGDHLVALSKGAGSDGPLGHRRRHRRLHA